MNDQTEANIKSRAEGQSLLNVGLADHVKTFFGYPISWFEKCDSYLDADGVVNKDGSLGLPDHRGFVVCFRMKNDKRKIANWGG